MRVQDTKRNLNDGEIWNLNSANKFYLISMTNSVVRSF